MRRDQSFCVGTLPRKGGARRAVEELSSRVTNFDSTQDIS